jgi:c-di-GMP-related signal transduction protein
MFRFDSQHDQANAPRYARTIPATVVRQLLTALSDRDQSISDIAIRIAAFPALNQRILRMANSALTGTREEITDPVHAASMLGSRRLTRILSELPVSPEGDYVLPESDSASTAA